MVGFISKKGFLIIVITLILSENCVHFCSCSSVPNNNGNANTDTLEMVQIIFRHGARNPDRTYPTDPYNNESYWPGGWHQLTSLGIVQEYESGTYLRKRYAGFLSETYNPRELYVLSSDIDRTIVSAQALVAGLYPPHERVKTSTIDKVPWKPIPIHTIPTLNDNIIRQEAPCPRYKQISDEFKENSEVLKQLAVENKELYEYFSINTGLNITNPFDFADFYDALIIEHYFNYTLPSWAQPVVDKGNSTTLGLFYFQMLTYSPEMKKLRAGPILNKIQKNMEDKMSARTSKKMFLFSGHDHTITTIMDTLGVFNGKRPPFAAALIIELHKDKEHNTYQIKIFYRNDTNDIFHIELPTCRISCDYDRFINILTPFIPTNWEIECQLKYGEMLGGYGGWLVLIILLVVLLCITRFLFSKSCCSCNSFSQGYIHL